MGCMLDLLDVVRTSRFLPSFCFMLSLKLIPGTTYLLGLGGHLVAGRA